MLSNSGNHESSYKRQNHAYIEKIVYFDHIATFNSYGIKYRPNHKNANTRQMQGNKAIPAEQTPETMPEHVALRVRPILKNRLNADLRQVN